VFLGASPFSASRMVIFPHGPSVASSHSRVNCPKLSSSLYFMSVKKPNTWESYLRRNRLSKRSSPYHVYTPRRSWLEACHIDGSWIICLVFPLEKFQPECLHLSSSDKCFFVDLIDGFDKHFVPHLEHKFPKIVRRAPQRGMINDQSRN
jgi:hypothetical protein